MTPPCVIFEDDCLLVVNKPAGLNTHAPSPFAGEGLYEWLRDREPRWADLAIIHRLDKETSGLIVFSKTRLGNKALTQQFTNREVTKKYVLLTDRPVRKAEITTTTSLIRAGDRYLSRPVAAGSAIAKTRFLFQSHEPQKKGQLSWVQAEPLTGRTHQIRVHAADNGFPILGDTRYGGTPADRVCLHAAELVFRHPASGEQLRFTAEVDFFCDPGPALRTALIDPKSTNAFRMIHGAGDGWPGLFVSICVKHLLVENLKPIEPEHRSKISGLVRVLNVDGIYEKRLAVNPRAAGDLSPKLFLGQPAPPRFIAQENGTKFELSFAEGYSIGLFLDQRENRRRLLTGHIAAGFSLFKPGQSPARPEVLNTFAYTCGFSVCAAKAGARVSSLDLSRKYLEWGKRNFLANQLDPAEHSFVFGDVFDWLKRFAKASRLFDVVLLDPPTFSRSKQFGVFRAQKDYGRLVRAALPLLKPGGVLFASSNAADWAPAAFLQTIRAAIQTANRSVMKEHYVPQPPDFPVTRDEPAYLKTVWIRLS